jgi:hypothetical protein
VIAQHRKETVLGCARAIRSDIRRDVRVIILADVGVDRFSRAIHVVVIARRHDRVHAPPIDQRRDVGFRLAGLAVVADDGQARALAAIGRRRGDRLIDRVHVAAGDPHRQNQRGEDRQRDQGKADEPLHLNQPGGNNLKSGRGEIWLWLISIVWSEAR